MRSPFMLIGYALIATSTTVAAHEPIIQPVQVGQETVRYDHAVPTLDLRQGHGAVQITPLPMDHGGLAFEIAVYNAGSVPANFDIDNIAAHAGAQALPGLSRNQLDAKARHRAMWASIALAAVGGIGAAAAASQRDYYHSTLVTPNGVYRATLSAPSSAGQFQAAALVAGTGVGLAAIQSQLDQARAAIGDSTIQLTTIDPGATYAARLVLPKLKGGAMPQRVDMVVQWNGEAYPFAFQLAKDGTPAPRFTALTTPPPIEASAPATQPADAAPPPAGSVVTAPTTTTS